MTERFNSGMGGYTCDRCNVLLWAGPEGSRHPEKRIFCYSTRPEDVVQRGKKFYCKQCGAKSEEAT